MHLHKTECDLVGIPAHALDNAVLEELKNILDNPAYIQGMYEHALTLYQQAQKEPAEEREKHLRNVGPSITYKLRDAAGQAVEYHNYMLPVELDGQRVFLLGLRETLVRLLAAAWPDLTIVAQARNGREAVELFETHAPQVVFLDVHMPGQSGIDAARSMVGRAQVVFVTAYEQYAVKAFEQGAIDYLVKPFEEARLVDTVQRLKQRLAQPAAAPPALESVLEGLQAELQRRIGAPSGHLQWIKASVGQSVRLIPVDQVVYLKADEKYTLVVWDGGEALIRKTIRELADELDPERFVQIHRSVIVNLARVTHVTRGPNETAEVHLEGRPAALPVSRSFVHLFRQM